MTREEAIEWLTDIKCITENWAQEVALDMAIEALSAEAVPQSEQYKKGFEDAKRAFLLEYARELQNMSKRNAQLEVMLNAQKAISAEAVQVEWIKTVGGNGWNEWYVLKCPNCGATIEDKQYRSWEYNFCPNCGAKMCKGGEGQCRR